MVDIMRPVLMKWAQGAGLLLDVMVDERHHLGQPIGRENDVPTNEAREAVVRTVGEHIGIFAKRHSEYAPVAYTGNGNALANFGFVVFQAGRLFHLAAERVYNRSYTCITAWVGGRVSIERLWFGEEYGNAVVQRLGANGLEDCTNQVDWAASGQPLIEQGRPTDVTCIAEEWYDLRHLIQQILVSIGNDTCVFPNHQLQQGLARQALLRPVSVKLDIQIDDGTAIPLDVKGWMKLAGSNPEAVQSVEGYLRKHGILANGQTLQDAGELLRVAEHIERQFAQGLHRAGYEVIGGSANLEPGQVRYINGHIEIFFKQAIYPHAAFLEFEDGSLGIIVWPGASGRKGTTLASAQEYLMNKMPGKVIRATLLDNGGDVRLWAFDRVLVPSFLAREEMRSILVLSAPQHVTDAALEIEIRA